MRAKVLALLAVALLMVQLAPEALSLWEEAETVSSAPVGRSSVSGPVVMSEHVVYEGGCGGSDLHLAQYLPDDSPDGRPVVVTWCGPG